MDYFECNREIKRVYKKWSKEISECFFSSDFSNIFCTGVPNDWFEKQNRILIVGQETTWTSRDNFKNEYPTIEIELEKCQNWIIEDLSKQLKKEKASSPFWEPIQKIYNEIPNSTIMWTEIDVINMAKAANEKGKRNTALDNEKRKILHSTNIRLLNEIVNLVKPSIIVFLGWHDVSLKHEMPSIYYDIYPNGNEKNNTVIKNNDYIFLTKLDKVPCILSYHPRWQRAHNPQYKNRLVKTIKENL